MCCVLAGGIVLHGSADIPLYCMSCKSSFIGKKKEESIEFEVLIPEEKSLLVKKLIRKL